MTNSQELIGGFVLDQMCIPLKTQNSASLPVKDVKSVHYLTELMTIVVCFPNMVVYCKRNISEKCHQTLLTNGSMVSEKKNLKIFSVMVHC